jgi:D-alanyl-D-alanine carboxypeptidase
VIRVVLLVALAVALHPPFHPRFHASIQALPSPVQAQLKTSGAWRPGCPVPLSRLRLLTVSHWGFDRRTHTGQLVVNRRAADPLAKVFRRLYKLHFPIRHLRLADAYGPRRSAPDGDISGSFDCSEAVPSPCEGGSGTGSWSNHAYGEAVDLNPIENPYTCAGRVHQRASRPYVDRSRLRRGMVTPEVVRAFRSVGWGWGGAWAGSTKDYTHFSASGN